jgi:hypothetical protein
LFGLFGVSMDVRGYAAWQARVDKQFITCATTGMTLVL